jgi:cobalt-zinc-cadmium resistance protein CzcA
MASDLRRAILKHPEVSYVVTQVGRNDDGTDPWTMSHIEAPVGLKPYDTWPGGESKKAFLAKLRRRDWTASCQATRSVSVSRSLTGSTI